MLVQSALNIVVAKKGSVQWKKEKDKILPSAQFLMAVTRRDSGCNMVWSCVKSE